MNDALLTLICVLLTMLTTALGCVALGKLMDSAEDNREQKARKEEC